MPTVEADHGERSGPADLGAFVDGEDEGADGDGREDRADDVEAAVGVLPGVGDDDERS